MTLLLQYTGFSGVTKPFCMRPPGATRPLLINTFYFQLSVSRNVSLAGTWTKALNKHRKRGRTYLVVESAPGYVYYESKGRHLVERLQSNVY